MNHIELFAGCGGLSLGLEAAGFSLLMANELSPMAAETYAYNILGANLDSGEDVNKTLWISSQYSRDDIKKRLNENPYDATGFSPQKYSDFATQISSDAELKRTLWVGSIVDLNELISKKGSALLQRLQDGFGEGGVDLVSGGPPCQSFSMAGLRQRNNYRNELPWEFTKFIQSVQPKIALLENVSGILRPFKVDNIKYFAWFEVAKAFAKVGYIPLCLHINAKYVGTPQNRPRFIMLGLRHDTYASIISSDLDHRFRDALIPSKQLFDNVQKGQDPDYGCLKYYDIEKDRDLFRGSILSSLFTHSESEFVSVKDAIDDLHDEGETEGPYIEKINSIFNNKNKLPLGKALNHELRKNGNIVRARFRLYQVAAKLEQQIGREITAHIKSYGVSEISPRTINLMRKHWLLGYDGERVDDITPLKLRKLLRLLYSSKHSQRVLNMNKPSPTVLGSPDDSGHYHESEATQRTLTVRELARIQSFPDWYEIRSKVTTGGQRRKFEVPQYTQIGNAVPPLLGRALGLVCAQILSTLT
jgi:DNA (cytosine-5)-methyltransferase 1